MHTPKKENTLLDDILFFVIYSGIYWSVYAVMWHVFSLLKTPKDPVYNWAYAGSLSIVAVGVICWILTYVMIITLAHPASNEAEEDTTTSSSEKP